MIEDVAIRPGGRLHGGGEGMPRIPAARLAAVIAQPLALMVTEGAVRRAIRDRKDRRRPVRNPARSAAHRPPGIRAGRLPPLPGRGAGAGCRRAT
jgi:hypothetical protein